ncbi:MAG: 2-oxo acid dehydrogenase subunit E2, partial [Planctomycetota bacterium]
MSVELRIPEVGESVQEVQVGRWLKDEGEAASQDEAVVEIETDKVSFEIPAPTNGTLTRVLKREGEAAAVGEVIGYMEEGAEAPSVAPAPERKAPPPKKPMPEPRPAPAPVPPPEAAAPAARREEVVPIGPLRLAAAERLEKAHRTAAVLATVDEIDMSAFLALRERHGEEFREKHGVELGFLSFFVRATADALSLTPLLNAEIRGEEIVHHRYVDIGVTMYGEKGLAVPVLRNAERMGISEIERKLADLARRVREGALGVEDLAGGTFTIQDLAEEGALLSTPALNPPQSGALGLHEIRERPVGVSGRIELRPMMHVALAHDRRLVDGREASAFVAR